MHRNLVVGTLQSILRQAGISAEDFVKALYAHTLFRGLRREKVAPSGRKPLANIWDGALAARRHPGQRVQ